MDLKIGYQCRLKAFGGHLPVDKEPTQIIDENIEVFMFSGYLSSKFKGAADRAGIREKKFDPLIASQVAEGILRMFCTCLIATRDNHRHQGQPDSGLYENRYLL
jgi:hypothetical protein